MVVDPSPSKSRRINRFLPKRIKSLNELDPIVRSEEAIYLQSVRGVLESELSIRSGLSTQDSKKVVKVLIDNKKIFFKNQISFITEDHKFYLFRDIAR